MTGGSSSPERRKCCSRTDEEGSMKKETWKKRITKACMDAGTYQEYFDSVITSLAEILEIRDQVKKYYNDSGAEPIVMRTNKGGHTNAEKNPILVVYDDMNQTAMQYWKELGLTPKGLKAIDEKAFQGKKKKKTLESVFADMGI